MVDRGNQQVIDSSLQSLQYTLSEQIAHSTADLHLKEISEFLHGSVGNKYGIVDVTNQPKHREPKNRLKPRMPIPTRPIGPIASESVRFLCKVSS